MTTAKASSKTTTSAAGHDHGSMDFISQMVATGLSNTFDSLKDKVSANIKDNGEQYLTDALDKLKDSASNLADWSKKNPVKTAVAVAAVLAVTAFLVSTAKNDAEGSGDGKSSAKGAKPAAKSKSSARA